MLIDGLSRSRQRFDRALSGVAVEQANTQPTPENGARLDSLSWLAWHTARRSTSDRAYRRRPAGVDSSPATKERFALDLPGTTAKIGTTPRTGGQSCGERHIGACLLVSTTPYAWANDYLRGLKGGRFRQSHRRFLGPPVTLAARLVSIVDDAAQHSGQAVCHAPPLGLPG